MEGGLAKTVPLDNLVSAFKPPQDIDRDILTQDMDLINPFHSIRIQF